MKIRILLALVILLIGMNDVFARNCGTMEHLEQLKANDPTIELRMQQMEEHTNKFLQNSGQQKAGTVISIPVVVHVIYKTSAQNVSDAQIQSQLDVLNEDFRRTNSDANNKWSQAADTEIEFCLATVDPNGNATSGITRKYTSKTSWGTDDKMKYASSGGVDAWPTSDYLNLWVCNLSNSILGYAQFPNTGVAATDGVVVLTSAFGRGGSASAPFNQGRTATHEVGHWLNLRHIWGDGACGQDDFVSDTPTSDAANYGCATGHTSCSSTDMVENYMDYSDDACMNLFTSGQKSRMRALFASGGARASLASSGGCGSAGGGGNTGGGCSDNVVNLTITLDQYGSETTWSLKDDNGSTVASGGPYTDNQSGTQKTESFCLPNGCYDFTINDAYGDGICCGYGNGSYNLTNDGSSVASGASFGSSETKNFCLGSTAPPAPTCNDGIQNGNETGVDCGGSSCAACPTCNDGIQNGNETGVDCGGSNCAACPSNVSYCDSEGQNASYEWIDLVRLGSINRSSGNDGGYYDGTGLSTDLGRGSSQDIYISAGFSGQSYTEHWHIWIDFNQDGDFNDSGELLVSGSSSSSSNLRATLSVPSNAALGSTRMRVTMKYNAAATSCETFDYGEVEDYTVNITNGNRSAGQEVDLTADLLGEEIAKPIIKLQPNLVTDVLQINVNSNRQDNELRIISLTGQVLQTVQLGERASTEINVADLTAGVYFVALQTERGLVTEKFIKLK